MTEQQNAPEYLDYAHRALRTARLAFDDGDMVGAINRADYAIFYAGNAMLELEGLERSKHSHVLSVFWQKYVKTEMIAVEYGDIYGQGFQSRNQGDYERAKFPDPSQAENALREAKKFVDRIAEFLKGSHWKRSGLPTQRPNSVPP
jgi:uncharacterized protein